MNICSHNTVHKLASLVDLPQFDTSLPPASLGDAREDDLHMWILQVEVVQVLLHRCDEVEAFDTSLVIPATVDEEDIWGCSSSPGLVKEGGEGSSTSDHPSRTNGW